jgi:hypothetical protein
VHYKELPGPENKEIRNTRSRPPRFSDVPTCTNPEIIKSRNDTKEALAEECGGDIGRCQIINHD